MANRPVFTPGSDLERLVMTQDVEFRWFPGMSKAQKQRSIAALHEASGLDLVLEISSKSPASLGERLSAFNLQLETSEGTHSVENYFQAAKSYDGVSGNPELLTMRPWDARREAQEMAHRKLKAFAHLGEFFPLEPKTGFYDWLYLNALRQHPDLADRLLEYQGFTDIEFNPKKSINCQARSAALYCGLIRCGLLNAAMKSRDSFWEVLQNGVPYGSHEQRSLFDTNPRA